MVTVHLRGKVTVDRQLIVELPDSIPPGDVQLTLEISEDLSDSNAETTLARAKLAAAGILSAAWKAPPGTKPLSNAELDELGTLS